MGLQRIGHDQSDWAHLLSFREYTSQLLDQTRGRQTHTRGHVLTCVCMRTHMNTMQHWKTRSVLDLMRNYLEDRGEWGYAGGGNHNTNHMKQKIAVEALSWNVRYRKQKRAQGCLKMICWSITVGTGDEFSAFFPCLWQREDSRGSCL